MKIETGRGTISLATLIAIWSISLVVNLPGLAITPILNNIEAVFPHSSELEVQLLTILPNLCIIPFVLLSGKLSVSKNKIGILSVALAIYLASGIAYFFAGSMTALIVISCLLGVGCGLVIPIAAGLIADYFTGKYRTKQLGIKSGIANLALVVATFTVGWLSRENWHLPFVVYLVPLIPLLLTPLLRSPQKPMPSAVPPLPKGSIQWRPLGRAMLLYGVTTYAIGIISYYLPFIAGQYHINDSQVGVITALFFIAVMAAGFILPSVIKCFKSITIQAAICAMFLGLLIGCKVHNEWIFGASSLLLGFGYGIIQPVAYEKAVESSTGRQSTLALALVLTMNYAALTVAPFIVDFFKWVFHTQDPLFPYLFNSAVIGIFLLFSLILRQNFTFNVKSIAYK